MKNISVLVTGAGGFIGSHLVEHLVKNNFEVTALLHYNSRSDLGWLKVIDEKVLSKINVVFGDITDSEFISSVVKNVDIVLNLAALIAIPFSYISPRTYFNTNTIGVLNICEAAISFDKKLIQFSTSEVYGNAESLPITEKNSINPQSPYAASKANADNICLSYKKSFGLKVNILRPFNTFGPRQSLRAIIPTIIGQFLYNDAKINLGNVDARRDFTYVSDTVMAAIYLINYDKEYGKIFQIGTGKSYSIKEIISSLELISGIKAQLLHDSKRIRPRESEIDILIADSSEFRKNLPWKPQIEFIEGLKSTYDWFNTNKLHFYNFDRYTI